MAAHEKTEGQRFIHSFLDETSHEAGDALDRIGERGSALSRMARLRVPVPEGFVVSVENTAEDALRGLDGQIEEALERLEGETGRTLWDP